MPVSHSLRPLGGWDLVSRGRFEARHDGHVWTVDLDYFDFDEKLHLYRDGVEVDVQKSPAKFELDRSATIEAVMGLLRMRQVELIVEGETTMLTPVDGTAEAWRLQLARERPETSRLIGAISWVVLVVALIYEVPQLIALAANALGADFEPPFALPGAANFMFGMAALAAASERALRFKSNRGSASASGGRTSPHAPALAPMLMRRSMNNGMARAVLRAASTSTDACHAPASD